MMRLADRLGLSSPEIHRKKLFREFGILENPFPPQSQTMGHPHKWTSADDIIVQRLRTFLGNKQTQVLVVAGEQGYGKTNLLEYYKNELSETFLEQEGYYILRYYPDPEPDFGKVVQRIVQEFGVEHLQKIGKAFAQKLDTPECDTVLLNVRGNETRKAFFSLAHAAASESKLEETARLLYDYLLGVRLLKQHLQGLNVQFRLDTTESKTQALHDLVYFSKALGCLEGIFLFMDELEKINVYPLSQVARYLSAIRALIDALPEYLFLILAMTPTARNQYARILPALAGRLREPIPLTPVSNGREAIELYRFYLEEKRKQARDSSETANTESREAPPLPDKRVAIIYTALVEEARRRGDPGVTPRALLDRLHDEAEQVFASLP